MCARLDAAAGRRKIVLPPRPRPRSTIPMAEQAACRGSACGILRRDRGRGHHLPLDQCLRQVVPPELQLGRRRHSATTSPTTCRSRSRIRAGRSNWRTSTTSSRRSWRNSTDAAASSGPVRRRRAHYRVDARRVGGDSPVFPRFASRPSARLGDRFTRCLYATYLSYLRSDEFAYRSTSSATTEASLAEFLKSPHCGQVFVSRTKPGITRGNHYHHTKTEKFLVSGRRGDNPLPPVVSDEVLDVPCARRGFRVVDIPPGYTHSIENVGTGEMVVLFWASEVFDPDRRPTPIAAEVLHE